jgi:hypothetical protein
MDDNEKLKAAQELDEAYARAEEFHNEQAFKQLDAYGHLEWTVGDENYLCCFDAGLAPNGIAYHVVIDCESGGWIDTVEKAIVPLDKAEELKRLPWRYADVCAENEVVTEITDIEECAKQWIKHIDSLVEQAQTGDAGAELRKAGLNRGKP